MQSGLPPARVFRPGQEGLPCCPPLRHVAGWAKAVEIPIFAAWCLLAGTVALCETPPPDGQPQPEPASAADIIVCHTRGPITVDGKLDEPDWEMAATVSFDWEKFWEPGPDGKRVFSLGKAKSPISWGKLLWDDENLYLAFSCKDADLIATLEGRDSKIWTEDAIELFVRPSRDSSRYWEYEWSPKNQVLDIAWGPEGDRDVERDKQWNGTGQSATAVQGTLNNPGDTDQGWQIEVRIPFKDFEAVNKTAPKPGDVWSGMLLHYSKWMEGNKKHGRTLLSCPTMDSSQTEKYNRMIFSAEISKAAQPENKP